MEIGEAKSAIKAIYLQAAALAGLEVSYMSPERFVDLVDKGYSRVKKERRPEAVANALRLMAETLMIAQEDKLTVLSEANVDKAKDRTCPIYPFD